MPGIPDIPGSLLSDEHVEFLKRHVAHLCGLERYRFPGSQPISFSKKDIARLEHEDYWVCEKSDGVRVLVFVHRVENESEVYLIDRHDHYRLVSGFYFPHHTDIRRAIADTILDGELVIDVDPRTRSETLRLLLFDCLVHDQVNIMNKPLSSRYGRMKEWFIKPYEKVLRDIPSLRNRPFDIHIKRMEPSYHVEKVIKEDIPNLQHGSDGLIYTCAESAYVVGTDERILKWKPPYENSIDFRLELRFPPLPSDPSKPDFFARPQFILNAWLGGKNKGKGKERETYEYFDIMNVDDDEWMRLKETREQIDDRIVEVRWDPGCHGWKLMRFRDDKPEGNHRSTVDKIIQSIIDGVEQATLIEKADMIRRCWKEREMHRRNQPQQPQLAQNMQHHHHHPPPHPYPPAPLMQLPPPDNRYTEGPPRPYASLGPPILSKVQGPDVWEGMRR